MLPMFEKDIRKTSREKRQSDYNSPRKKKDKLGKAEEPNTVYGELKLSE